MSKLLNEISVALQNGKREMVRTLTEQALEEKISAKDILEQGLLAGMDVIAEKFKKILNIVLKA